MQIAPSPFTIQVPLDWYFLKVFISEQETVFGTEKSLDLMNLNSFNYLENNVWKQPFILSVNKLTLKNTYYFAESKGAQFFYVYSTWDDKLQE